MSDSYHFHRDCIYYEKVTKEARPDKKHKKAIYAYCPICKHGLLYYCESDFEDIKTDCKYFKPKQIDMFSIAEQMKEKKDDSAD